MGKPKYLDRFGNPMRCKDSTTEDGFDYAVCDFCIHFNMYKSRDGSNIDGSGNCGLHRKETDAGDGCEDFYCFQRFKLNQKKMYGTRRKEGKRG